mgnify:CR=1 FL=1
MKSKSTSQPAKTWIVTRHRGATDWLLRYGFKGQEVAHLDISLLKKGDLVIGNLPVHLAAEVCRKGARYFHLCVFVSVEKRGVEMTVDELERQGAHVAEYRISKALVCGSASSMWSFIDECDCS